MRKKSLSPTLFCAIMHGKSTTRQGFFFLASFVIMPDMMCRHLIKGGKRSLVEEGNAEKDLERTKKKPLLDELNLDLHAKPSSFNYRQKKHDESTI